MTTLPKPEKRRTTKRRADRLEAIRVKYVRAACVERDGYCRVASWPCMTVCAGPSEWAHLEGHRRFETRGMTPEQRHATTWTMMLCKHHHDEYDNRHLEVGFESEADGADSPIRFVRLK